MILKTPRTICKHPLQLAFHGKFKLEDTISNINNMNIRPIFHTDCSKVFASRWLKDLFVRNLPNKLREHSSRILSLCYVPTLITTPSFSVNLMFCSFCCLIALSISFYNSLKKFFKKIFYK